MLDSTIHLTSKIARLRLNKKVKVAFISVPTPILMAKGSVLSPNRTNYFPISQITLGSCLKNRLEKENIPWEVTFSDLKSLENIDLWDQHLEEYGQVKYGEACLTKYIIGDGLERLKDEVAGKDIICITANFTFESNIVKMAIEIIKKENNQSLVLVGGQDVSARPEYYHSIGADITAIGDGDVTLPEFLCRVYRGESTDQLLINRILSRPKNNVNLNELPFPDIKLVGKNLERYHESGGGAYLDSIMSKGNIAYYQTSRGCYRDCHFCLGRLKKVSELCMDRYYEDIDRYKENNIITLMFCEDNLMQRLHKGMKGEEDLLNMFQYLREKKMVWEFPVGLEIGKFYEPRSNNIKHHLMQTMLWNNDKLEDFIGLFRLLFPIENSLSNEENEKNRLKKMMRLDKTIRVLQEMLTMRIPQINLGIMFGWPYENQHHIETIKQKISLITQLSQDINAKGTKKIKTGINYSIFCATPLPGTPFHQQMLKEKRIKYDIVKDPELWNLHLSVLQSNYFKPEQIAANRRELLDMFDSQLQAGKVKLHLN